jgi:DNA-binding NarL/FixJ family response regulator
MAHTRVVVVNSHLLYREALARLLADLNGFEVIAAIANATELSGNGGDVDTVLVDARQIRQRSDVTGLRSRFPGAWIVAVGINGTDREAVRCTRSGIDGIISHETSAADIVSLMNQIRSGGFPGSERTAAALFSYVAKGRAGAVSLRARLTRREREIARLAANGLSNKRIAQALDLQIATVKNNMHNILKKCGLSRRGELAARFNHQSGL